MFPPRGFFSNLFVYIIFDMTKIKQIQEIEKKRELITALRILETLFILIAIFFMTIIQHRGKKPWLLKQ